jgi:hypothetical protein
MHIERNRFLAGLTSILVVACAGTGVAQTAPSLPSSLHVVLLQATNAEVAPPANLPPTMLAAVKAASGSRSFKAMRLLDQAVVRVQGSAMTRLKGPGSREYVLAASSGSVTASTANEIGAAVHLFQTKDGVLEPSAPEVLWAEFTAKAGEGVFVWPWDEKTGGSEPLVLMVTPLNRENAATLLRAPAKQALDSLVGIFSGDCAVVVDTPVAAAASLASPDPAPPSDSKAANVRVEDGALVFDAVGATKAPASGTAARPRAYRIALRGLTAPEIRVNFGRNPTDPFTVFSFPCGSAGCVAVDGSPSAALAVRVCADRTEDFLKAMQTLIVQAGGGWEGQ